MSYQSGAFLLFAAAVVLLYYVLGKRLQKYVLLLSNIVFMVFCGPKYIPYLAVTLVCAYVCGLLIGRIYDREKLSLSIAGKEEKKEIRAAAKKKARRILIVSLIVSIGLLGVCKYLTFIIQNLNSVLRRLSVPQIPLFEVIMPIGISFYTFMAVGYMLDVYWKRYDREKNPVFFAVFLTYFPHFVQGPIDRYNAFKTQIEKGVSVSWNNLTRGAELVLWGMFKKLVIADRVGIFVDSVYGQWEDLGGFIFVIATVMYAVQIYTDFSGCIDIVTGVSEMMGIRLAENFRHPYFAKTIPDFWRRWHMSLTGWFRDYVYLPVSMSRLVKKLKGSARRRIGPRAETQIGLNIPVAVVWILTGVWHGAAWKYIAWGLYYAVLMILGNLFAETNGKLSKKLRLKTESFGWKTFQVLRTFFLTLVGRVLFRAETVKAAAAILCSIFTQTCWEHFIGDSFFSYGLNGYQLLVALFAVLILWIVDLLQEKMKLRDALAQEPLVFRWILIFGCLFAVLIFGIYGPGYDAASFIYEQF